MVPCNMILVPPHGERWSPFSSIYFKLNQHLQKQLFGSSKKFIHACVCVYPLPRVKYQQMIFFLSYGGTRIVVDFSLFFSVCSSDCLIGLPTFDQLCPIFFRPHTFRRSQKCHWIIFNWYKLFFLHKGLPLFPNLTNFLQTISFKLLWSIGVHLKYNDKIINCVNNNQDLTN